MTALATTSTSTLAAFKPLPMAAVEDLFTRLLGQLGNKVADLFGNAKPDVVKEEWAATLAGFRRRELQRGLDAIRLRRFAPTSGEFAQLCRPALDHEYAWYEAQDGLRARDRGEMGQWSHPAVYRSAIAMGGLGISVRNASFSSARTRWKITLDREFAAGWGEEIPEPALRITKNPTLREIPSELRQKLSDLSQSFSARKGV